MNRSFKTEIIQMLSNKTKEDYLNKNIDTITGIFINYDNYDKIQTLLQQFYKDIPGFIYIKRHIKLPDNIQQDFEYKIDNIDQFITILSFYCPDINDHNSDIYKDFIHINKQIFSEDNNNQTIKGGGKKNKKYNIITDGTNRFILNKNKKYQIINETNKEYLLNINNNLKRLPK
jgi:hypothetical protein